MSSIPWIMISILIVLVLLGVIAILATRKKKTKPDYYTFFIMGIIWLAIGIPLDNWGLTAMGFIFAIVGLVHKDKWKENRQTWDKLDSTEKKIKIVIIAILGLLVLAGLVVYLLFNNGVI